MKVTINKLEVELKGVFVDWEVTPNSLYLSINRKPVRDYKDALEGTVLSLCTNEGTEEDEVSWEEFSNAFTDKEKNLPMRYEETGELLKEAEIYQTETGRKYLNFKA